MSVLRTSLEEITVADLESLISSGARETGNLEFKGTLPCKEPLSVDRWFERGDRIGDYARDKLLSEVVAFANADGGTLVLGLHETDDEPPRAGRLEALPECEGLARRLFDVSEDIIEPRLLSLNVRAVPAKDVSDGSGYIVVRVGKSEAGPHRLSTTRDFYVRRGERAAKMTVREIHDRVIELSRSADHLEAAFDSRGLVAVGAHQELLTAPAEGIPPVVIRVTAIPISKQTIPGLTTRENLWWLGRPFSVGIDRDTPYQCSFPADDFYYRPSVRLRSFVANGGGSVRRLLRADGAVEFMLLSPTHAPYRGNKPTVYWAWIIGLAVGTIAQVDRIRTMMAWDAADYALEVQILSEPGLTVKWNDHGISLGTEFKETMPLTLPRYELTSRSRYDDVVSSIMQDLFNAAGTESRTTCTVPWDNVLPSS